MITVPIVQGTDDSWDLVANTRIGPVTGVPSLYNTDTFTAELWMGGSTPGMLAPTITWLTSTTYNAAMTATQSQTLNYGVTYLVNVYRDRGSAHNCIGIFKVLCLPAPSSPP